MELFLQLTVLNIYCIIQSNKFTLMLPMSHSTELKGNFVHI